MTKHSHTYTNTRIHAYTHTRNKRTHQTHETMTSQELVIYFLPKFKKWDFKSYAYLRDCLRMRHNLIWKRSNNYATTIVKQTKYRKKFLQQFIKRIFVFGLNRIPVGKKLVGIVPIEVEFHGLTMRFRLPKELFGTESESESESESKSKSKSYLVLSISFLSIYGPEMTIFEEDGSSWGGMEPISLENFGKTPSPTTVINTIVRLSVEAGGYPGVPGVCRLCKECGNLSKFHMFSPSQLNNGRKGSKCKKCVNKNTCPI